MTFRLVYTADGIHNYFWKARPVAGDQSPRPKAGNETPRPKAGDETGSA
jgi:hypothetical protein